MRLFDAAFAPNPRRLRMFMAEKQIPLEGGPIERIVLDLPKSEHRTPEFRQKSPLAQVPCLELDDGTCLTESRAICTFLESLYPEPNLMGEDAKARAFIEMWDRRAELLLAMPLMLWVRHANPNLAAVERNQSPEVAAANEAQAKRFLPWLESHFGRSHWMAGDAFSIADITLVAGIDFAKMNRWRPGPEFPNILRWRADFDARPAGQVGP